MNKKTIGILGCGWLGLPLAESFIAQGHAVKGTTTKKAKLESLTTLGIDAYQLVLHEMEIDGAIDNFLANTHALVINIPPGLRSGPNANFPAKIRLLMERVQAHKLEQVLFVSSTSVFEDAQNFPVYTEDSNPNATSNNGKQLMEAELAVRSYYHTATIIRPGGLIGSDRNPIKMLAGKTDVKNPDAPVNLVDRDYLIALIINVLHGEILAPVIHAISEPHRSRKDYYTEQARRHGLEVPEFDDNGVQVGKVIVSAVV